VLKLSLRQKITGAAALAAKQTVAWLKTSKCPFQGRNYIYCLRRALSL